MKIVKRIGVWVIVSIAIQCLGLFYVNSYVLSEQTTYESKKVVVQNSKKPEVNVNIPDDSTDINISFDGKYVAYYEGDALKVVNANTGEARNVEFGDGVKVSFYKWLPDRNRMLIAEKITQKNGSGFTLSYYDVDKNAKVDIKKLSWADSKSEVEDIQLSTLTNVIYVKVAHSGMRSSIYKINIMNQMENVDTRSYLVGTIRSIQHSDKLAYEDLTYHRIDITGVNKPITIKGVDDPSLIAVDGDDNIYVGQVANDKVVKIYSGSWKDDPSTWKVTELNSPMNEDDIFVSQDDKIYLNDALRGIITDLSTGKQTIYQGRIINIYSDGIASVYDGKLIKTSLK